MVSEALHMLADGRSNVLNIHNSSPSLPHSHIPRTFHPNYSWMRVKAPQEYTPEHADIFYFKVSQNICFMLIFTLLTVSRLELIFALLLFARLILYTISC